MSVLYPNLCLRYWNSDEGKHIDNWAEILRNSQVTKQCTQYFNVHPPEESKLQWWKILNQTHESISKCIDDGPNPSKRLISSYPSYLGMPRGTALQIIQTAVRTTWGNECREYNITNPFYPHPYIRDVPRFAFSYQYQRDQHAFCAKVRWALTG